MFNKFVNALKTFFSAKPVSLQFEEMLLAEAVQEIKAEQAVDAVTEPAQKPKKPAAKKPATKKKPNIKLVK